MICPWLARGGGRGEGGCGGGSRAQLWAGSAAQRAQSMETGGRSAGRSVTATGEDSSRQAAQLRWHGWVGRWVGGRRLCCTATHAGQLPMPHAPHAPQHPVHPHTPCSSAHYAFATHHSMHQLEQAAGCRPPALAPWYHPTPSPHSAFSTPPALPLCTGWY